MGCKSCKSKKGVASSSTTDYIEKVDIKKSKLIERLGIILSKIILFIFAIIIGVPIVIPFTIYALFNTILLNKGVDVTTGLVNIGKMLKNKSKDDEETDGDISDFNEDELVMMDIDEIK